MKDDVTLSVLSGSTSGRPIAVAATSSPGTAIHTASFGSATDGHDVITLYAHNIDTVDRLLYLQIGGTGTSDQLGPIRLQPNGVPALVFQGPLTASLIVKAYADAASKINIFGDVSKWEAS